VQLGAEPGKDAIRAGSGNDTIDAADGFRDVIDCGKGQDTVTFDRGLEKIADNCEPRLGR
jgi:hypothetical protein